MKIIAANGSEKNKSNEPERQGKTKQQYGLIGHQHGTGGDEQTGKNKKIESPLKNSCHYLITITLAEAVSLLLPALSWRTNFRVNVSASFLVGSFIWVGGFIAETKWF